MTNEKKLVIVGGGGHAKVVLECALMAGFTIVGFTDTNSSKKLADLPYLGTDNWLLSQDPSNFTITIGVGNMSGGKQRMGIFTRLKAHGFKFPIIRHPASIVAKSATIDEGCQIMPGAIIQPNAQIGKNVILNTACIIEHDVIIGEGSHIAPGAVVGGGVHIGTGSLLGLGSRILPGIKIGDVITVGIGATVIRDIADGLTVVGIPAKPL